MALEITIGRLAKAAGVNLQTIRFYERAKLLRSPVRSLSGYRLYGKEDVQRLFFIKRAQALGFTLKEIAELLNLRVTKGASCAEVQRKTQAKLGKVELKVRDLRTMARALRRLLRSCETGQPTDYCPMLESLAVVEKRKSENSQIFSKPQRASRAQPRGKV